MRRRILQFVLQRSQGCAVGRKDVFLPDLPAEAGSLDDVQGLLLEAAETERDTAAPEPLDQI